MCSLDAKALAALLEALKSGKLQLALGGKGGGPLWGGKGGKTDPMKENPAGKAKLTMTGKKLDAATQAKVSKEFAKYAAMGAKPPKNLPNAMVKGVRNQNDTELVQHYRGDPERGMRAGTPLYDVTPQGKRVAESAIGRENIPAQYRPQVKKYFETISP